MGRVTRSSPDLAQVFKPTIFPLKPIFRNFVPLPIAILLVVLAVSGVSACRTGLEPAGLPAENDPAAVQTETELPDRNSTPIPKTVLPTPVPDDKIATNSGPDVSPEPPPSLQPFPDPPERDLYRLAALLKPGIPADLPRVVNEKPVSYQQGRQDTFWLLDLNTLEYYRATFDLRLVTPHGYWYVDQEQEVRQEDLEEAAREFEDHIYQGVTDIFGAEWSPGVDNDPHLNILNSRLRGAGGYFSSSDEYPLLISPYSNQREIIYMNIGAVPIGTEAYLGVLAHELQHAVHWNADASEDTWVNEGLSDLAVALLGYGSGSSLRFLSSGPTSMVHWPISGIGSRANYGAASLFMHYLVEHYGNSEDLRPLVDQTADGIGGINAYLKELGHRGNFPASIRGLERSELPGPVPAGPHRGPLHLFQFERRDHANQNLGFILKPGINATPILDRIYPNPHRLGAHSDRVSRAHPRSAAAGRGWRRWLLVEQRWRLH